MSGDNANPHSARFQTTRWSLVLAAREAGEVEDEIRNLSAALRL